MRKLITLLAVLTLAAPLMFLGCSGDDGSDGANGAPGAPGAPGPAGPGALAKETCVVCHGAGAEFNPAKMHGINAPTGTNANTTGALLTSGTVTAIPSAMTFTPAGDGDNVTVSVTFTFKALNSAGTDVTSSIDLTKKGTDNTITYLTFMLAKLTPGVPTAGGGHTPNEWSGYILTPGASGSGPFSTKLGTITGTPSTGVYTYTFPAVDNGAVRGFAAGVDNQVHRLGIQVSSLPISAFFVNGLDPALAAPVGNGTIDWVPVKAAVPTAEYPTRDIVTTAACNQCHDPLAIHGGSRRETKLCVVCHNPNISAGAAGWDNATMVRMVHGIHSNKNLGELMGDFSEITYPPGTVLNCDQCHKGTDADNWMNVPSREGCGSCHTATFTTGAHAARPDTGCDGCHSPTTANVAPPTRAAHADNTLTPTNVPAGLDNIVYFLDNVSVDNVGRPTVQFHITRNGANLAIPVDNVGRAVNPTGYTGNGPSFQFAYALPQDGVTSPVDFNNLNNGYSVPGRTQRVYLTTGTGHVGQVLAGDNTGYTITFTDNVAKFPTGAKMKTVTMDGYWSQTVGSASVPRHAVSLARVANGDTARRVVVDSNKCLACHVTIEGHGGNRINNVQNCVTCHNTTLNEGGVSFNMKDMIHGIHAASATYNFSDVTYPANLKHCTKCHIAETHVDSRGRTVVDRWTFQADLPSGVLLSTDSLVGGGLNPTPEDLVVSPTAAACGRCHNSSTAIDHFRLQGGDVDATRAEATVTGPVTIMAVDITP